MTPIATPRTAASWFRDRAAMPSRARLDLAGIGAQTLGVQPLDGALHQRREILAAAGQRQRFDKEADRIRRRHALDQRAGVVCGESCAPAHACSAARADIEHVAAGGFDEQRFLGAEIIGDLARKGVGRGRDVGDRGAGQPALPEQAARRRAAASASAVRPCASRANGVLGIAGTQSRFW
jgi:hypothetical protein